MYMKQRVHVIHVYEYLSLSCLPPIAKYLKKSHPDMRGSLAERGGLFMMSLSGGLKPRAVAGRPSVTRLTHNNCTGINASGIPRAAVRNMLKDTTVNIKTINYYY